MPFGVPALANRQRYANLRYRRLLAVATKTVVPGFQRLARSGHVCAANSYRAGSMSNVQATASRAEVTVGGTRNQ